MVAVSVVNQNGKYIIGPLYLHILKKVNSVPEFVSYFNSKKRDKRFLKEGNAKIAQSGALVVDGVEIDILGIYIEDDKEVVKVHIEEIDNGNK